MNMIKKITCSFATLVALCLVATSCSNEEETVLSGNQEPGTAELTLSFNDGGNTRAARPVNSSEAANEVDQVKIFLFKANKGEKTTYESVTNVPLSDENGDALDTDNNGFILEWEPNKTLGNPGTTETGRNVSKKLTLKGLKAGQKYYIVAYGYKKGESNEPSVTQVTNSGAVFTATPGSEVEEIFAGATDFTVGDDGMLTSTLSVLLKRQVAGFIGYFKNIPVELQNQEISGVRVKAIKKMPSYKFGTFTYTTGNNSLSTDLINGCGTAVTENVYIYDMAVPDNANKTAETYYTFQQEIEGVDIKPNSLLNGCFLVPFTGSENTNQCTFEIELYNSSKETISTIKVKNGNEYNFGVKRNQFYMLGKKYHSKDPKDPNNPENPDPDDQNPDEPIDLTKVNEVEIIVNDAWDVIHNLGIEW